MITFLSSGAFLNQKPASHENKRLMIADVFHFVDPVQKAVKVLHDMTPNYLRQLISVLPDSGILLASELRSP